VAKVGFYYFAMNLMLASFFSGWQIILIVVVILVLFGAKKIPDFAKGLGQGIREFKKASKEVTDEINSAGNETPASSSASAPANTTPQSQSKPSETKVS
jgi:sec-independent protein translocase protein TatA